MRRTIAFLLLATLVARPLEAQGRMPRKWVMAGVGGLVTGIISLAFITGNPNTDIGGCNSKQCVVPVTVGAGLFLGFLIGSEMDHLYNLRYAHAPPLDLPSSEVPLTLVANDLTVRRRTVLVAGEGGVELIQTNPVLAQLGVRARGLRGIGSVTSDSVTNALLVGTGVGLDRFPLTGDEAGTLAHAGEISAASADSSRVAVGLGTAFQIAALEQDSLRFFGDPIEEGSRVVDVQWGRGDILWVLTEDRLGAYRVDTAGVATLVGADSLPATGRRLAIEDSIALIAAGAGGVFAVSLSDPTAPKTLANWSGARFAYDATIVHGIVYLAAGPEGLYILDLSPTGFSARGLGRDAGFVAAVKSDGKAIYLIDRTGGQLRRITALGQ